MRKSSNGSVYLNVPFKPRYHDNTGARSVAPLKVKKQFKTLQDGNIGGMKRLHEFVVRNTKDRETVRREKQEEQGKRIRKNREEKKERSKEYREIAKNYEE